MQQCSICSVFGQLWYQMSWLWCSPFEHHIWDFLLQEFSSPKSGSSGTGIAATESMFVTGLLATEQSTLLLLSDWWCCLLRSAQFTGAQCKDGIETCDISFLSFRIDVHFRSPYTTSSVKFHLCIIGFTTEQKPLMKAMLSYTEFM
jgi:hypothetical protein